MKLFSEIGGFLSIYFTIYVMFYGYNVTSKNKRQVNFIYVFVVAVVSIFILIANNLFGAIPRLIITITSQLIGYFIIFRDRLDIVLFKTFIMFVLLNLCDSISSILYLFLNVDSSILLEEITLFRSLSTILASLLLYLIFLIKPLINLFKKLFNYVGNKWSDIFLILSSLACIAFLVITYFNAMILDFDGLIISFVLIIFFLVLCFVMIYQYFKNKNNEEEQENLLKLMTDYEVMLDKDRINRHEMLNNLVALKSFKNKGTKDFEDMLDGIIKNYEDKKSKVYSNLYKLPSGIKGVVYYKMNTIKELEINFNLLISKEVEDKFESLNQKLYFKICKILGIILDNAIEATSLTSDKLLLIDIYLENKNLIIYVENEFVNNVDLNTIYTKGVSSKGKNRGYGLFIVKKIVNETNELTFEQSMNNSRFITTLKIKIPSDLN